MMALHLNLHGLAKISLVDEPPEMAEYFRLRLGAFEATESANPDIQIEFVDSIALPENVVFAGDNKQLTAAFNHKDFYIQNYGGYIEIPIGGFSSQKYCIYAEKTVKVVPFFNLLMFVIIQHILLSKGATLIHASAVSCGDKGVVLTGWRDVGKTSLMLRFLRDGAGYMADDLAILTSEGKVLALPMKMNLSLKHLGGLDVDKRLLKSYYAKRRARKAARAVGGLLERCPLDLARGLGGVLYRAGDIDGLTVQLSPPEMGLVNCGAKQARLKTLFFLNKTNRAEFSIGENDKLSIADKMVCSLLYEVDVIAPEIYEVLRFAYPKLGERLLRERESVTKDVIIEALQDCATYSVNIPRDYKPDEVFETLRGLV